MNKFILSSILVLCTLLLSHSIAQAQLNALQVNTSNSDARVQIEADDRDDPQATDGILIPRVNVFPSVNPSAAARGMLVFLNQDLGDDPAGFYYWTGSDWIPITGAFSNIDWSLVGNAGTNPNINFLGTTDSTDLVIRSNSNERVRVTSDGRVGIGMPPSVSIGTIGGDQIRTLQLFDTRDTLGAVNQFIGPHLNLSVGPGTFGQASGVLDFVMSGVPVRNRALELRAGPRGRINFNTGNEGFGTSLVSPRMTIDSVGNVGVGNKAPIAQLTVSGIGQTTAAFSNTGNKGGTLYLQDAGGVAGNGGTLLFGFSGGNNGIFAAIKGLATNGGINSAGHLAFSTRNTTSDATLSERLRITQSGSVGIGTASPDQQLSVNGNASKVGGGSWATFSDKRLKKDVMPFNEGLKTILQINPVRFKYNGKAGYPNNGKEYIGVIAQDIATVAPYMVEQVEKNLDSDQNSKTNLLMYDPSALVYILTNAVKEQQKVIDTLNKKLHTLEATLTKVEILTKQLAERQMSITSERSATIIASTDLKLTQP